MKVLVAPQGQQVLGPVQAAANIQKNTEISSEITLLSQRGSRVVSGAVQLIPVGESIVYVQPFFTIATNSPNPFPQFQFVATLVQGKSPTKGQTVTEALEKLFGTSTTPATPETPETPSPPTNRTAAELLAEANQRFADAEDALRAGDLGRYQELVGQAQDLVDQARQALGSDGGGSASTTSTTSPGPTTSVQPNAQEASLRPG
jgi:hypothetical protein